MPLLNPGGPEQADLSPRPEEQNWPSTGSRASRNSESPVQASLRSQATTSLNSKVKGLRSWFHGKFLINPETSRNLRRWDLLTTVALLFVCFVSPYEVAFMMEDQTVEFIENGADALFWINRIVDLMFFIDMVLQFFIMYPVNHQYLSTLVVHRKLIVRQYLKTWFAIDLLSILPFDIIGVFLRSNDVSKLRMLRALRLLRLLKLARLLRGMRLLRRWQEEVSFSYRKLTLTRLLILVIVTTHWFSCILGITSSLQGEACIGKDLPQEGCAMTWLSQEIGRSDGLPMTHFQTYSVALFVATTIVVHPIQSVPQNEGERLCFIVLLFCGGFLWTRVISRTTAIATSMDRHNITYHQTMDDLNAITLDLGLPNNLQKRLRAFFMNTRNSSQQGTWKDLIDKMSPSLRTEVAYRLHRGWLRRVPYLRKADKFIIQEISVQLNNLFIAQEETFGSNFTLYIMNRGVCSWSKGIDRVVMLTPGSVWGEEHLLLNDWRLLVPNTAYALTFVEALSLDRPSFKKILEEHPDYQKTFRNYYLWYAMFRTIIFEARQAKEETDEGKRRSPRPSEQKGDKASHPDNGSPQGKKQMGDRALMAIRAHYAKAKHNIQAGLADETAHKRCSVNFQARPSVAAPLPVQEESNGDGAISVSAIKGMEQRLSALIMQNHQSTLSRLESLDARTNRLDSLVSAGQEVHGNTPAIACVSMERLGRTDSGRSLDRKAGQTSGQPGATGNSTADASDSAWSLPKPPKVLPVPEAPRVSPAQLGNYSVKTSPS